MTQKEMKDVQTKTSPTTKTTKNDPIKQSSGDEIKKKSKNKTPMEFMTRVVVRQLPPTMSEEQFLNEISPLPEHTEFYYVNGDLSLGEFAFSRAYIKFNTIENVLLFKDKYDDYVFIDSKGNEYPAIVEYAPIQKLPRRFNFTNIKKDSKVNTIESDPDFINFKEKLENNDNTNQITAEQLLEEIENKESKENANQTTPLIEFLNQKRLEKNKTKDDKKLKREDKVKKKKKDEEKNINNNNKKEKEQNKHKEKEQKIEEQKEINKNNNKVEHKLVSNKSTTVVAAKESSTKDKEVSNQTSTKTKSEKNINKIDSSTTEVNSNSNKKTDKDKKEQKESTRIRNKDRPTREIYRPGMARQKSETTTITTDSKSPKTETNSNQKSQKSETKDNKDRPKVENIKKDVRATSSKNDANNNTTTNNNNTANNCHNSQKPAKYKERVFTRTRN